MQDLQKIKDIIRESKEVAIISHYHPDGDTLGSQIALALGLEKLGINALLINKDPVPASYQFLTNWQNIKFPKDVQALPRVLIFVDCATIERSGINLTKNDSNKRITINIDHHVSNTKFADYNWIDPTAAATAELIYDLLGLLQVKIDNDIATALYTAISTDTGSFLYENTTPTTHRVASDLINRGADIGKLRVNFYENVSFSKINLLKFSLNNLFFASDNKVVWVAIDQDTFQQADALDPDGEGLINYLKSISGVEVALVFRELTSDKIKISFRSKKWFDVNKLAGKFGGGGHPKAAGCVLDGRLNAVVKKVINTVEEQIAQGGAN